MSHYYFNLHFLVINYVEQFSICLLVICMPSSVRYLLRSFTQFLKSCYLFSCCWVLRVLCILWVSLPDVSFANIFLLLCGLPIHSLNSIFHGANIFNFNEVQLINYLFMDHALGVVYKKSPPYPRSSRFSTMLIHPFKVRNIMYFLCFLNVYPILPAFKKYY